MNNLVKFIYPFLHSCEIYNSVGLCMYFSSIWRVWHFRGYFSSPVSPTSINLKNWRLLQNHEASATSEEKSKAKVFNILNRNKHWNCDFCDFTWFIVLIRGKKTSAKSEKVFGILLFSFVFTSFSTFIIVCFQNHFTHFLKLII